MTRLIDRRFGLAIAIALLALSGCAATSAERPAASDCAATPSQTGAPPRGVPVPAAAELFSIQLDRFRLLSGTCADAALAFVVSRVLFTDGRVMRIGQDGSL